jgi:DNA adenine methylase
MMTFSFDAVEPLSPLIKWAGGKRRLLKHILPLLPTTFNTYYEPFAGGAALFFHIRPNVAVLSDTNAELINMYEQVRDSYIGLSELVSQYFRADSEEFYYHMRNLDRDQNYISDNMDSVGKVRRAARFLYLNRRGFNGLYRVNSKGQNNVPYGGKHNQFCSLTPNRLWNAGTALQGIGLGAYSYSYILNHVKMGDFVYLDPPYLPISKTSSFTSYSSNKFDLESHQELMEFCRQLDKKSVQWLLSGSSTNYNDELYSDWSLHEIDVTRTISAKSSSRGKVKEILVKNY